MLAPHKAVTQQTLSYHITAPSLRCAQKRLRERDVLIQTLKAALATRDIGLSTDKWTDNYSHVELDFVWTDLNSTSDIVWNVGQIFE